MLTYFNCRSLTLSVLGMFFAEVESLPRNPEFKIIRSCYYVVLRLMRLQFWHFQALFVGQ
jgi:hypothetical protein